MNLSQRNGDTNAEPVIKGVAPEPIQIEDWENEGGGTCPAPIVQGRGARFLARMGAAVRDAARLLTTAALARPASSLAATFAVGLGVGALLRK